MRTLPSWLAQKTYLSRAGAMGATWRSSSFHFPLRCVGATLSLHQSKCRSCSSITHGTRTSVRIIGRESVYTEVCEVSYREGCVQASGGRSLGGRRQRPTEYTRTLCSTSASRSLWHDDCSVMQVTVGWLLFIRSEWSTRCIAESQRSAEDGNT
jgi:hypothetical protein